MTVDLTLRDLHNLDLTKDYLTDNNFSPLYVGDDWDLEFLVLDSAGNPLSLSGALIVMTVQLGNVKVTRRSDTDVTGSSPAVRQILIDPDQVTAGKGRFTIHWTHYDVDILLTVLGMASYDIIISRNFLLSTRDDDLYACGLVEVIQKHTERPVT